MTLFNNLTGEIMTNEEKLIKIEICYIFKTCVTLFITVFYGYILRKTDKRKLILLPDFWN